MSEEVHMNSNDAGEDHARAVTDVDIESIHAHVVEIKPTKDETEEETKEETKDETEDETKDEAGRLTVCLQWFQSPYKAATFCLGLMCVLLLAGIIVLGVHYMRVSNHHASEMLNVHIGYKNLTAAQQQLQLNYKILIKERDQLHVSYGSLVDEKVQLQASYDDLVEEKDQLQASYDDLVKEKEQSRASYPVLARYVDREEDPEADSAEEPRLDCLAGEGGSC